MGRITRSWELTKQSYRVLMLDKELMVLPLISMLACLVVMASFAFGAFQYSDGGERALQQDDPVLWVGGLAFYVVVYTVGFFFQAAVIAGATERLQGGDPTVGSALSAAWRRFPAILLWGVIAGTVGMLLRSIQERSELLGRIVVGLIGAAWSLATFFMVPVLVMEEESVGDSFKRSWALFKQTWGETFAGSVGFGIASVLLSLPVIALALLFFSINMPIVGVVVGGLGLTLIGLFIQALHGVWVAALYRYATQGDVPEGYDPELIAAAFKPKS